MNVRTVMSDPQLSTMEEKEQPCIESLIVNEIISSIRSIRQEIELCRQLYNRH